MNFPPWWTDTLGVPKGFPRWFQTRASLITGRGWRRASDSRVDLGTEREGRTTRSTGVASPWTTSPLAFISPPPPPPAVSPVLLNPWREYCDAQALPHGLPTSGHLFVLRRHPLYQTHARCTVLLINNWRRHTLYLSNENWRRWRIFTWFFRTSYF